MHMHKKLTESMIAVSVFCPQMFTFFTFAIGSHFHDMHKRKMEIKPRFFLYYTERWSHLNCNPYVAQEQKKREK